MACVMNYQHISEPWVTNMASPVGIKRERFLQPSHTSLQGVTKLYPLLFYCLLWLMVKAHVNTHRLAEIHTCICACGKPRLVGCLCVCWLVTVCLCCLWVESFALPLISGLCDYRQIRRETSRVTGACSVNHIFNKWLYIFYSTCVSV